MNDILIAQANQQGRPVPPPPAGATAPLSSQPAPPPAAGASGSTATTSTNSGLGSIFRSPSTTSNTDLLVMGGILFVLAVIFYVAKRGLTTHLIDRRASPSQADRTGWMLWIVLMSATLTTMATYLSRQILFGRRFALASLLDGPTTLAMAGFGIVLIISAILFVIYYRAARAR